MCRARLPACRPSGMPRPITAVSAPQTSWGRGGALAAGARRRRAGDRRRLRIRPAHRVAARSAAARPGAGPRSLAQHARGRARQPAAGLRRTACSSSRRRCRCVPVAGWADVVFSTATFHWIRRSPGALRQPARRLAARRTAARAVRRRAQPGARPRPGRDGDGREPRSRPTSPAGPAVGVRLGRGDARRGCAPPGSCDVVTELVAAPTTLATETDYRAFVTTVIYHPHLAQLPEALRPRFIDEVTALAARRVAGLHARLLAAEHDGDAAGGLSRVSADGPPAARTGAPRAR